VINLGANCPYLGMRMRSQPDLEVPFVFSSDPNPWRCPWMFSERTRCCMLGWPDWHVCGIRCALVRLMGCDPAIPFRS
jgi:hypothetical protein